MNAIPSSRRSASASEVNNGFAVATSSNGGGGGKLPSNHAHQRPLSSVERLPAILYSITAQYLQPHDIAATLSVSKACHNLKTAFFLNNRQMISRAVSFWKCKFAQIVKGPKAQFSNQDLKKICYLINQLILKNAAVTKTLVYSMFGRFPGLPYTCFPNLRYLRLDDCPISKEGVVEAVATQQHLQGLSFNNCTLSRSLQPLSRLVNLQFFELAFENATNLDLMCIPELTNLTFLNIKKCTAVTNLGLGQLAGLANLKWLRLNLEGNRVVNDAGLQSLNRLTNLEYLDLNVGSRITNIGLQHLSRLPKLSSLRLNFKGNYNVTNADLQPLSQLVKLESLDLKESPVITDDGLQHLTPLTHLTNINLSKGKFTWFCLHYLAAIPTLRSLNLSYCKEFSLPQLADLDELSIIPSAYPTIPPAIPRFYLDILKRLENIETLHLRGCLSIDSYTIYCLSRLSNLRTLDLSYTLTSEKILPCLTQRLVKLQQLYLMGCPRLLVKEDSNYWLFKIANRGQEELSKFTSLQLLALSRSPQVTPTAVTELRRRLPQTDIVFSQ